MDQNLSDLDLKLFTDSADTALSGKLFHTDTWMGDHLWAGKPSRM